MFKKVGRGGGRKRVAARIEKTNFGKIGVEGIEEDKE